MVLGYNNCRIIFNINMKTILNAALKYDIRGDEERGFGPKSPEGKDPESAVSSVGVTS